MSDIWKPRKGSMAYRPRKRAKSQNVRMHWQNSPDKRVLGFAGYKVGMTHISYVDESDSPTKGQEVISAATVIEVPPIAIYGIRLYKGKNSIGDLFVNDDKLLKLAGVKRPKQKQINEEDIDSVRLLAIAFPSKTGFGKKHPEKMELGCGGANPKEQLEYCKGLLGKKLRISEVFKSGEYVDVVAVSKGKGWQGAVRRFGVSCQRRKATGKRRHIGTLGQWHPPYVLYTIPQAGQTGYHRRTELNKMIMKIGDNPEEVNPSSGFPHYGFVKNDFVVVKGSVPGPVKRLVKLRLAVRASSPQTSEPKIGFISMVPR